MREYLVGPVSESGLRRRTVRSEAKDDLHQPIAIDMVLQEINRYPDKFDEVAIEAMVWDMGRQEDARKRHMEEKG